MKENLPGIKMPVMVANAVETIHARHNGNTDAVIKK
jgi:hypothetical protein